MPQQIIVVLESSKKCDHIRVSLVRWIDLTGPSVKLNPRVLDNLNDLSKFT